MSGGCKPLLYGSRFQGEYAGAGSEYPADDALYHLLLFHGWFCVCGRGVERQVLWSRKQGGVPGSGEADDGLRRRGGDSFHLIIYSGWRKLSLFVDQRQAGGGGCGRVSGMGGAYSAGRYVGICLRWHFCGHHPVEVYVLFYRCSFCFILRNVFCPSSFAGQSRPLAGFYPLPCFTRYRIVLHLSQKTAIGVE